MYPRLLQFGSIVIDSYDLFLSLGFLLGTIVFLREIRREGKDRAKLLDLTIYLILISIAGARLFHVAVEAPSFYIEHPLNILKIWNGGWTFYGGLLPAVIFGIFYVKKHNLHLLRSADLYAPPLALGLGIGRIGCFLAGCCYGKICSTGFPFGVTYRIVNHVKPQADPLNVPLYPTQVLESLVAILIFIFLIVYRPKKRFEGELSAFFLIFYSAARFLIEFLRADDIRGLWFGGALSTSQIISIPLFLIGILILVRDRNHILFMN